MTSRITIGNTSISGYVNQEAPGRLLIGTGSYVGRDGKVFKESVSVFLDQKFDGTTPAKGDYVTVRGDLTISPRRDRPEELNATMNVRFADQLEKSEAPRSRTAETADAGGDI